MPKKCAFVDEEGVRCPKYPIYNYEGEIKLLYCNLHKEDTMVNVKDKPCIYSGCKIRPTYNYEGKTNALYCSSHRLENMIDVKNRKCIHDGCITIASCNYHGEKKGLYCKKHKLQGMSDIINKLCIYPDCRTRPTYNYKSETKPILCCIHKHDDMINVKSKRCIHEGCTIIPNYNYANEKTALYCYSHKLPNMKDIKNKTCRNEWCNTYTFVEKYDGYCVHCFIHMFPDKPVSRNYKTKERCVVESITSHFPDFSWVADKTITDGCSRRRPDLILDLGYQVVIVEVDENQHVDYDCSCENKRIMELSQDVSHRPLIIIRFNPDEYTDANGDDVTSCWGMNKLGLCVVKKSKEKEWESRLERLREQVEYWTNPENATEKTVEIVELFYDCD